MIKNLYNELYFLSEEIYLNYNNKTTKEKNKIDDLLKREELFYELQDYDTLFKLYEYALETSNAANLEDYENYELAFYGEIPSLIIRRIFYKLVQRINRFIINNNEFEQIDKKGILINKNIIYISNNIEQSLNELQDIAYTHIEIRFLYFLINEKYNIEEKEKYIRNMIFIDSFLEEYFKENENIQELILKEDLFYNNLWNKLKNVYQDYLLDNIIFSIEKDIIIMYSKRDINNFNNTKIREIYLRTLFNYLDIQTLNGINKKLKEEDLYPYNKEGYNSVLNAFKLIEQDKNTIKKIKTR